MDINEFPPGTLFFLYLNINTRQGTLYAPWCPECNWGTGKSGQKFTMHCEWFGPDDAYNLYDWCLQRKAFPRACGSQKCLVQPVTSSFRLMA